VTRPPVLIVLCPELEDEDGQLAAALDERLSQPVDTLVREDVCAKPQRLAAAVSTAHARRVVIAACRHAPPDNLIAAARAGGAQPFAIEIVTPPDDPARAAQVIAAAVAKLRALRDGDGSRVWSTDRCDRRGLLTLQPKRRVATASIRSDRCAGSARCGICAAACPHEALVLQGPDAPAVLDSRCDGCAACVAACPHAAIGVPGAEPEQLEAQLDVLLDPPPRGLLVACRHAGGTLDELPTGWFLVEVPTLAIVTAGWLLHAASRGTAVRLAACEEEPCRRVRAPEAFARAALAALDGAAAGSAPLSLTEPRATSTALLALAPERQSLLVEDEVSPLGLVACDTERCTLCGACTAGCPTGALQLDEKPDETALTYDATACLPCGRCAVTCPEQALAVQPGLDLNALRRRRHALARSARGRCRECGEPLLPLATLRRVQSLLGAPTAPAAGELCTACALATRAVSATAPGV
jgi:ferredoxin